MLHFEKLLLTITLAVRVTASVTNVVPPALKGAWNDPSNYLVLEGTLTDTESITNTIAIVDQKSGAIGEPNQPVPDTAITAVDGQLTAAGSSRTSNATARRELWKRSPGIHARAPSDYELVFGGTGVGLQARDASIQGTAYLTFTLVNNATYNVEDCLNFCDQVDKCVFANLYYEYNNDALDHRETSNLKCAVYADVHSAAEKTNFGGQQLEAPPAGLTYIQQSSGWSAKSLVEPTAPDGYELTYGPTGGANNSPGYMGFAFLDRYDVDACAQECNKRGADGNGGACQYFNIWRAVVNGDPTTYSCSMYFVVSDESTAVNYGQGDLKVTFARGYQRKNYVVDGGFEGLPCSDFCYKDSYSNWVGTSPVGGNLDASIFHYQPYAHAGNGVGLLGSASGLDTLSGTLSPAQPLQTQSGKNYVINFFHASAFSGPLEANAVLEVLWNNVVVYTIHPGYSNWQFYSVPVIGQGNDVLAFRGGAAPAWSFIDDVAVFLSY
ncbi:hypothetical protein CPB83DRAFT_863941 [Crepidotus variabilis]|uniref:Fruit-body specific protein a n=1 Tax=Crepidotus variabilis TaxID=179855 RepID=A0A9P6JJ66_9AGAR|nr:hypothetical protein CPB83DRAFT_863941 [Crepidotus variabilis]